MREKVFMKKVGDIRCYVIPKKNFIGKQAMVIFNYGSCDNDFTVNTEVNNMPKGIAHFLEHKMFEDESKNVFDQFTKLGATVNAFTNFNSTAYYFSCTEKFEKNLRLLLEFVSKPYFTRDNVEKEKGIIKQEIKMYEDDPMWSVFFNMLKCMYKSNPVKENIAGTVDSIDEIDESMLYKCYETFYNKSNAAVICATDTDKGKIFDLVEKYLTLNNEKSINRLYGDEDDKILQNKVVRKMEIQRKIFNFGFKETDFSGTILDRIYDTKLSLDIIAGKTSPLYEKLYAKGLIDYSFDADYTASPYYGFTTFAGLSDKPEEVVKYVIEEINSIKEKGFSDSDFQRIKNKSVGSFIKGFNSIDAIVSAQADLFTKGVEFNSVLNKYKNADYDMVLDRIRNHFNEETLVTSIVTS